LTKEHGSELERSLDLTFAQDKDFVAVEVLSRDQAEAPNRVVNAAYLKQYKLDESFIDTLRSVQRKRGIIRAEALFSGKKATVEIRNSTVEGGAPLFTIGMALAKDDFGNVTSVVLADIRLDRLQKVFTSVSEHTLFLIDSEGHLLAHPDEGKVLRAESVRENPIVKAAMNSDVKQGQLRYKDAQSGQTYTGAYTKTALGVTAIAVASDQATVEAARGVRRESFYIAGRFVAVSLFLMFLFSITLTLPIQALTNLANEVARGNADVKAKINSRDEVEKLAGAMSRMIEGFREGGNSKPAAVSDRSRPGVSSKTVTVLFSDIRDFTKFSEGHTPEEVVAMLNEYFEVMVAIINNNGGVVDKFIGDAIMAVWGAVNGTERDAQNAISAALQMRLALAELNERRGSRGQVPIKIGMGIHRGDAISGSIGSQKRMEYTVIGDTVNQASRVESSTKTFGADILMSQEVAALVQEEFILEEAGPVEVKGKSEPLTLYKVRGFFDENKKPVEVHTPYTDYEAHTDTKVKLAG
jgi:adenylate cyclase